MAAILRGEAGEERRLPERPEAVFLVYSGEASEKGVDEDRLAVVPDGDVVDVDVAGGPG